MDSAVKYRGSLQRPSRREEAPNPGKQAGGAGASICAQRLPGREECNGGRSEAYNWDKRRAERGPMNSQRPPACGEHARGIDRKSNRDERAREMPCGQQLPSDREQHAEETNMRSMREEQNHLQMKRPLDCEWQAWSAGRRLNKEEQAGRIPPWGHLQQRQRSPERRAERQRSPVHRSKRPVSVPRQPASNEHAGASIKRRKLEERTKPNLQRLGAAG